MFDTNHKRRGLIGTIIIHAIMIVIFVFFGMKYQDPPPEPGIAIVFGFDKQGQSNFKPVPKVATTTKPKEIVKEVEKIEETPIPKSTPEVTKESTEQMMTQDSEESPISAEEKKKKKEEEKKKIEEEKTRKEQLEKERIEKERIEKERIERERIKAEQEAKKKKLDGMFSNLKSSEDATGKNANQGDDGVDGYKGSEEGLKNAKSFTGNGGVGDYGNYQLGNRKPKNKPQPIYDGSDQGIVVVRILVDKNGKVVYAEAGVKGSTTTDLQLLKRAKEAALATKWQSDATAPEKQEGRIIYNFIIEN
jgi:outer membrane biosynthesis protein TonB